MNTKRLQNIKKKKRQQGKKQGTVVQEHKIILWYLLHQARLLCKYTAIIVFRVLFLINKTL